LYYFWANFANVILNCSVKYIPDIHHRCSIRLMGCDYSQPGTCFVTMVTRRRGRVVRNKREHKAIRQISRKTPSNGRGTERVPQHHLLVMVEYRRARCAITLRWLSYYSYGVKHDDTSNKIKHHSIGLPLAFEDPPQSRPGTCHPARPIRTQAAHTHGGALRYEGFLDLG